MSSGEAIQAVTRGAWNYLNEKNEDKLPLDPRSAIDTAQKLCDALAGNNIPNFNNIVIGQTVSLPCWAITLANTPAREQQTFAGMQT